VPMHTSSTLRPNPAALAHRSTFTVRNAVPSVGGPGVAVEWPNEDCMRTRRQYATDPGTYTMFTSSHWQQYSGAGRDTAFA